MNTRLGNLKSIKNSLKILDNKYKIEIIYILGEKKMRFTEIKNTLGTITQQLLSKLLKQLEKDDILKKKQFKTFPRKVEYSLTPLGKSLKPITTSILRWEKNNARTLNKLLKRKKLETLFDYY